MHKALCGVNPLQQKAKRQLTRARANVHRLIAVRPASPSTTTRQGLFDNDPTKSPVRVSPTVHVVVNITRHKDITRSPCETRTCRGREYRPRVERAVYIKPPETPIHHNGYRRRRACIRRQRSADSSQHVHAVKSDLNLRKCQLIK